ncbi:MAG: hypothetical protein ORN58_02875, partial [Sediminibacterium sp.]|nr:hypothetical protein [Sediminibacterium sp.]
MVSVNAGNGGTINNQGNSIIQYGYPLSNYIVTPNVGYEIDSFKVNGVKVTINNNTYSIDSVKSNITILVTFKIKKYSVLTSVGMGGKISIQDTTVNYGSILPILITPNNGYEIDSFKVDGIKVTINNNSYSLDSIKSNKTITVTFKIKKYSVSTSVGMGGKISIQDTTINYGTILSISITPNVGYEIDSFKVDSVKVNVNNNIYLLDSIKSNKTIAVTFKIQTFTITASAGTGVNISNVGNRIVNYGDRPTYTFTVLPNYLIDSLKVYVNDIKVSINNNSYTFDSVKSNQTIYANIASFKFNLTALAGIGGSISPEGIKSVNSGESQEFIISPNIGYLIDSIFVNDTLQTTSNRIVLSNIVANKTLYVKFKKISYTISVSAGNFGTISSLGTSIVSYGDMPTFNITPNNGYILDSLIVNGIKINNNTNVFTLDSVKINQTIRVTFTENLNRAFLFKNASFQSTTNSTAGNGDYINLPTLTLDSNYTVETWFNLNVNTGTNFPFIYNLGGWCDNCIAHGLILNMNNRILDVRSWGSEANNAAPPNNLTGYSLEAGVWTHLAVVVRGRNTKVYVNGNLKKEYISLSSVIPTNNNTFTNNRIGNGQAAGGISTTLGQYRDFKIWKKARTTAEIQATYKINDVKNVDSLYYYLPLPNSISSNPIQTVNIANNTNISNESKWAGALNASSTIISQGGTGAKYFYDTTNQKIYGTYLGSLQTNEIIQISIDGGNTWKNADTALNNNWVATTPTSFRNGVIKIRGAINNISTNRIFTDYTVVIVPTNFSYIRKDTILGKSGVINVNTINTGSGNIKYYITSTPVSGIGIDSLTGQIQFRNTL